MNLSSNLTESKVNGPASGRTHHDDDYNMFSAERAEREEGSPEMDIRVPM